MPQRTGAWAKSVVGLAVLAVLASGGAGAFSGRGPSDPPAALPPELVAAWQKAGAKVGWMHVPTGFPTLVFLRDKAGTTWELPAFQLRAWKEGVLAKLP